MNFSTNLIRFRKMKGYTQEELAEKLQISRQSISKWENGEVIPDLSKTIKLAEILNVSIDQLCGIESTPIIETNQVVKAEQEINLKFKAQPILTIMCTILISTLFAFVGYNIGLSKIPQVSFQNTNVSNAHFSMNNGNLTCQFVPDVYFENCKYTILFIDLVMDKQLSAHPHFEDGIGTVTIKPASYHYQVVLQVSDGTSTKSIVLEDHLYLNTEDNTTRRE